MGVRIVSDESLQLLGGFSFRVAGTAVNIAHSGQRLLAYLALAGGSVPRSSLAGNLWPDRTETRALSNLRGVVWRLPPPARGQVHSTPGRVALAASLAVDVTGTFEVAESIRRDGAAAIVDRVALMDDLLPDWDDFDWLMTARERLRQLRLHALEHLAESELSAGRPLDAVDTALCAVAVEPLRESAQMLLLRGHLAAGNRAAALEQFDRFRWQLDDELALEPSRRMLDLIDGVDHR